MYLWLKPIKILIGMHLRITHKTYTFHNDIHGTSYLQHFFRHLASYFRHSGIGNVSLVMAFVTRPGCVYGGQWAFQPWGRHSLHCRMTIYELLRWLVETPSRDVQHYRMLTASRSTGRHFKIMSTGRHYVTWRSLDIFYIVNVIYMLCCFLFTFSLRFAIL